MVIAFKDSSNAILNDISCKYHMTATYDGSPFLCSFFFLLIQYLLYGWYSDRHKMCIITKFMDKVDCVFVACTLQCGPFLH